MQNVKTFFVMIRQLAFILNYRQKWQFFGLAISMIFVAALETLSVGVIIPFILVMLSPEELMLNKYAMIVMNLLKIENYYQILFTVAILVIAIYLLKMVIILTANYLQARFRNGLERDLSNWMLEAYLHKEYTFHINTNSSEVVRGVHSDVSGVASVVDAYSSLLSEGLTCILIGCFLMYVNPIMTVFMLGLAGVTSLCTVLVFKKKTNTSGEKCREAYQKKIQYIQQSENGIKDIIVRQKYDYFVAQFKQYSEQANRYNTRYLCITKVPSRVVEVVFISGLLLMSVFCVRGGGDTSVYVTQLGAFAVAAVRILPSISNLAVGMNNLIYFRPALEAAYSNLPSEKDRNITEKKDTEIEEWERELSFQNVLKVEHVRWRYNENQEYVLKDVSLSIYKGEAIALIGPSGAGKTTLADIILGLFVPKAGEVMLDGINIHQYPKQWSEIIGYVPQSLFLLDDTIRNNVAFGVPEEEIIEEEVWRALEQAQLKETVESWPKKLDTGLGELGVKISGGQRQRIAIARALYYDPEILVLDEATSALDTETEQAVMESVDALHGKKTLIIVAHRLSTIRKCDKIYEVAEGGIRLRDKEEVLHEG